MAERQKDYPENEEDGLYMKGYLQKRQRGKKVENESQRKKLKFQERFCVLNKDILLYKKKENVGNN